MLLVQWSALALTASANLQQYSNSTLLWGPYRPNLYVGIRPRIPESFMAGLMWANVDDYNLFPELRHSCEQGDDIGGYGWEQYDARKGGRHIVRDIKMGIDIETYMVKIPGGTKGGHWALRVKGTPRENPDVTTSVIFYAGIDGTGQLDLTDLDFEEATAGIEDVKFKGSTPDLGTFTLEVTERENQYPRSHHKLARAKDLSRFSFMSVKIPTGKIWQAKDALLQAISQMVQKAQEVLGRENLPEPYLLYALPNTVAPAANLHYLQKSFRGSFEFDVLYTSTHETTDKLISDQVSERITEIESDFDEKFSRVFKLTAPYNDKKYDKFTKTLFSNLLGGIGYFQGTSIVDRSYSGAYDEDDEQFWESASAQLANSAGQEEGPTELFTSVPSRAFFPRGFYWDEGFHLMPIGMWDQDLSLEIIKSWFALMDEDGWIGREQILGDEARSKVPQEFTTQYPHYANPPTLFIAIDHFLTRLKRAENKEYKAEFQQSFGLESGVDSDYLANPDLAREYLKELYPGLKKHYDWFRRTQQGEIRAYDREAFSKKEGYRWRGRTPDHCLTSGIDDYPRARPPHPGELHLDLHCWMTLMTKLLRNIAEQVDEHEDAARLAKNEEALLRNLDDLHWSPEDRAYTDQTIDDYSESAPVPHLGYISIFPVLLGLLPADSPRLEHVLKLIRSEDHLWSPYGLRSLSKQDEYYGTGENYWKGPIWININYLALSSLYRNYINVDGSNQALAQSIYTDLRRNVIDAIYEEYQKTGIFWEQYNPETGRGQRTKGFTGWTSCAVNIMAEAY